MATQFSKIYNIIKGIVPNCDLFTSEVNSDDALNQLSDYVLKGSQLDFIDICRKDLELYHEYDENVFYGNVANNVSQVEIDITNVEEDYLSSTVLYVNEEEIENFKISIEDSKLTLVYAFQADDEFEIKFIREGYFEETLTYREQYIIALGAAIAIYDTLIQDENNMIETIKDKDYTVKRTPIINQYESLRSPLKTSLDRYLKEYDWNKADVREDLM